MCYIAYNSETVLQVLVIGSNPAQRSPDSSPFHTNTKSRKTLDSWFLDIPNISISFANVVDHPTPNNRPLRVSEIKEAAPKILDKIKGYDRVVAIGKTAAKALDIVGVEHIKMPHVSGLNRQLNDQEYVRQKVLELTEYCS